MKIKILLTLLIIALITIAIICGCGGGSDTTSPASLITPTPNYTDTGDTAYITVSVKWPEHGNNGSLTLSKNGETIPKNAQIIDIYILDYSAEPMPTEIPWEKVLASGNIHRGENRMIIPVKIIGQPTPGAPNQGSTGPPPAIRVKIFAEAFSEFDINHPTLRNRHTQVARTDNPNKLDPITLEVGNQKVHIKLLTELSLTTTATETQTARSIIASDTGSSNEYDINANLQLMYGTPFPVSTVIPDTSGKTSEPLEGQTVNFKIIQGSGQLDAIQAQTDPNGGCKVHFTRTSAYNVIEASYQYDPDDPNTIVTSQCTIGDNYELTVDPNNVILNLPPLFKHNANAFGGDETPVPEDTPTPGFEGSNSVNITAKLNIIYPTPAPNSTATPKPPKPAEGKLIKFEIIEGNDAGTLLSLAGQTGSIVSGFTLADGTSTATLTTSTPGLKVIKASFQADPNDPNSIYSDKCYVTVTQPPPPPTATPEPTLPPTATPAPTLTPTPLPIPPYKPYMEGTWVERGQNKQPTGKTYTVTVTNPIYRQNTNFPYEVHVWMEIIVTDENGLTQKGAVVNRVDTENVVGWITLFGKTWRDNIDGYIYNNSGYFPGYHTILWSVPGDTPGWAWTKK